MNLKCDVCSMYLLSDKYCDDCTIKKKEHRKHRNKNSIKGEYENGNIIRDYSTNKATYGLVN